MGLPRRKVPEFLHSDTVHKSGEYFELSQSYAAKGDAYAAVHAMWMADMCVVQALTGTAHPDAVSTLQAARDGLSQAFDQVAMRLLRARLTPLGHLAGLPQPDRAGAEAVLARRLSGSTVDALIAQRLQSAAECMGLAVGMHQEGRHSDAITHAYQSDMGVYEAYLLEAARAVGDEFLMTVDLRWELAFNQISSLPSLPMDYQEATALIREKLKGTVSPTEADTLDQRFLAVA